MYDRMNELDSFFDDINIETDANDMSRIKKTVKRKAHIHTAVTAVRSFALGMVLLIGVTVIGVNSSPTFAEAVSKIPIIGEWISNTDERGIQEALENDCETIVNQTQLMENGDFTLSYVVADESNLIFAVEGNSDRKNAEFRIEDLVITNLDTGEVNSSCDHTFPFFYPDKKNSDTGEVFYWLNTDEGTWDFPDKIKMTFTVILNYMTYEDEHDDSNNKYEEETKEISFTIDLKKPQPKREYSVNKQYTFDNQKLTVTRVEIYPTCTNIYYLWDSSNTSDLNHIKFNIKKKNGKDVESKPTTIYPDRNTDEECNTIQSGYYSIDDDFDIVISEVYLLSNEKREVTLDTRTNKLYDQFGELKDAFVPDKNDPKYELAYEYSSWEKNALPILLNINYTGTIFMVSFDTTEEYPSVDDETAYLSTASGNFDDTDEERIMCVLPKAVIEADEDGIIHLERFFPDTLLYPNEVIAINNK